MMKNLIVDVVKAIHTLEYHLKTGKFFQHDQLCNNTFSGRSSTQNK